MTDTDIMALIERLRDWAKVGMPVSSMNALPSDCADAADALEALQERVHYAEGVADTNIARANDARRAALEALQAENERLHNPQATAMQEGRALTDSELAIDWVRQQNEIERLETERDAALFDKAVAGGKVRVAEARAEKAEAALQKKAP